MKGNKLRSARGFAIVLLSFQSGLAFGTELKVFSSLAFTDAWRVLKPKFEARGHKLEIAVGTSGTIGKRVTEGEAGDAILNTSAGIDALTKQGKVLAGTSKPIASCGVGISVRKGAPKPDISTPEALKRTLLSAKAVAYSDPAGGGASGIHFSKVIEQLGIAQQINAKAKLGRGVPNAEAVARGEADLAVQQIPELIPVDGAELVGPLPNQLQAITTFSAATLRTSKHPKEVGALIDFLTSPEAAVVLKAAGFEAASAGVK
jgi:molybdate transport system substrate-binding protein